MKKTLKWLAVVVGGLAGLMAVGVLALLLLVDPNDFKDDIAQAVHKATGRELALRGDIHLSFYPWLGLTLHKLELANAPGFGPQPFAELETVAIKAKLLPLLRQELDMDTLILAGLRVHLGRNAEGTANWTDLTDGAAAPGQTSQETVRPPLLAYFRANGVEVTDAALDWSDLQANTRFALDKITLHTGRIRPGRPIALQLGFDYASAAPDMHGHVAVQTHAFLDVAAARYNLEGLTVDIVAEGAALPTSPFKLGLSANAVLDLMEDSVRLDDVHVDALGARITGQLTGKRLLGTTTFKGHLQAVDVDPRQVLRQLGATLPAPSDAKALTHAGISMEVDGSDEHLTLSQLDVHLDDTHLKGIVTVQGFAQPALSFNLTVDALDVDRYLPAPTPTPATPALPPATPAPFPLAPLRALNIEGTLGIAKLKAAGISAQDISLGVKIANGVARLNPVRARLYHGDLSALAGLDVRSEQPLLSVTLGLTQIRVGELLHDLLDEDRLRGTATLQTTLTAQGTNLDAIMASLGGKGTFNVADGAVQGFNPGQMVREAYAKYKKQAAPAKQELATDFADLAGSFSITNGIVRNDDLTAKSPLLRVAGKGTISLPTQGLDYLVNVAVVESGEGQQGKELGELKGITVPVKIGGTFTAPTYDVQLTAALASKAKAAVAKQKERLRDEVQQALDAQKQRAKDKLQDKLKKLF